MNPRISAVLLAVFLAGLFILTGTAAEDRKPGKHDHKMFEDCAKACGECARICDTCSHHCAHMVAEGKREHLKTLRTCQDCATVCAAAGSVTARHGPFSDAICTACAEACKRCGEACEEFKDDEMMRRCARECRTCEKACREMLTHFKHGEKK